MFIRFVSGAVDEDSRLAAGLFCAALDLLYSGDLPQYEKQALTELRDWFDANLESPSDHLPKHFSYVSCVCWFKATAREYLAKAWEMVEILERNDVLIWTVKSRVAGDIYYEDQAQIFALPHRGLRVRLR
jgi:hypothetical protein